MAEQTIFSYLFLLLLFLFLGATLIILTLKKRNKILTEQLAAATASDDHTRQNLRKLQEKYEELLELHNSLGEAERTAKFAKPQRSAVYSSDKPHNTPERYSYIHSLAEKGLSVEEIASILTISTHEARQLVTLAKIAQGN